MKLYAILLLTSSLSCAAIQNKVDFSDCSQNPSNNLDTYFEYLDTYPNTLGPCGNADLGEIEIVRDRKKIAEIEQATGRMVGVVAKDKYWIWLNDAVKFPHAKYGVYGRILGVGSLEGTPGVAVLPILPNGKIALNRNFRHATRSWEYELPRGGRNPNETIQDAAIREVKEETGMVLHTLYSLGEMTPDTGLTNGAVPLFLAHVILQEDAKPEDSEAIAGIDAFSIKELKQGFIDGFLSVKIDDELCKINLRDPFLAFALFQAELRSLLPKETLKNP